MITSNCGCHHAEKADLCFPGEEDLVPEPNVGSSKNHEAKKSVPRHLASDVGLVGTLLLLKGTRKKVQLVEVDPLDPLP